MLGHFGTFIKRARGFRRQEEGATAIEFAFVSIPFFVLIFGIIELAIVFFVSSTMTHAIGEAGRQIRTGNFQACGGQQQFKDDVCAMMKNMGRCEDNLRIDVVSENSFKDVAFDPAAETDDDDKLLPPEDGEWTDTVAGDPVVIRATFHYQLMLPAKFTRLESVKGSNVRVLESITAFRNEPFPAGTPCGGGDAPI